jgi:iron complex outermembrane receptor protein
MRKTFLTLLLTVIPAIAWCDGEQPPKPPEDLTQLSIEDLMKVEVTTAAKKAQPLSRVAAAVYVLTHEDIRRSGATSIPELLRMVPGVQVARIDANKWAISVRGFNGRFSSKLLVLIDGRSVYTPLFSGVFWDVQDVLLEDIERIEVVRGPGGTLWGANAVNGVINIITKHSKDTQGSLFTAGFGDEERGFGGFRQGGEWGKDGSYRVYGKYFKRDELTDMTGAPGTDRWNVARGGFRLDRGKSGPTKFTLQGDVYSGDIGQRLNVPVLMPPFSQTLDERFRASGWNVLARWERKISSKSEASAQIYYDRTKRNAFDAQETRDTLDFDFQHQLELNERHHLIWGVGYRRTSDRTEVSPIVAFDPQNRADNLFSAFIQDEILLNETLRLTVGSKFEHNDYTGVEIQPNVRLAWTPDERRTLWAAVSRAVRTPSRADHDVRANLMSFPAQDGTPVLVAFLGNEGFQSEKVRAHELGYRVQLNDRVFVDMTAFYNVYRRLRTFEPGVPFVEMTPAPLHVVFPLSFDNQLHGKTYGFEIAGRWNATDRWRLAFGYALLQAKLRLAPSSQDTSPLLFNSPRQQLHVRSSLDLPGKLELDASLYLVGKLIGANIPGFTRLDVRLGWKPKENVEVSIGVQNLFDHKHQEIEAILSEQPSRLERSVYGKVTWRF